MRVEILMLETERDHFETIRYQSEISLLPGADTMRTTQTLRDRLAVENSITILPRSLTGFDMGDQFLDYYLTLPKNPEAGVPLKTSFIPAEVPRLLPHVFVRQSIDYDTCIDRLRGTMLESYIGAPNSEDNLFSHYNTETAGELKRLIASILGTPCVGVIHRTMILENKERFDLPTVLCPFADKANQTVLLIGVAVLNGASSFKPVDLDFLFSETEFHEFRFIDTGSGTPEEIIALQ